jgi:hypothetical protein
MDKRDDVVRLYELLNELEHRLGGKRRLSDCTGASSWPKRGVYFFFEPGEVRSNSGRGPRVVRIGTHALRVGSKSTLWNRLSQHRGSRDSGGNHRGSIFRIHVGTALQRRDDREEKSWGVGSDARKAATSLGLERELIAERERPVELAVSEHIGAMELLWLNVDDEPGPSSSRGIIECNSIGLLSNFGRAEDDWLDPPSVGWLGRFCSRPAVRESGLWNVNHVADGHDPQFLRLFEGLVENVKA